LEKFNQPKKVQRKGSVVRKAPSRTSREKERLQEKSWWLSS